jgi:hypothetical protein
MKADADADADSLGFGWCSAISSNLTAPARGMRNARRNVSEETRGGGRNSMTRAMTLGARRERQLKVL